jgi:site-specific DNA-adenine methylase
MLLKYMPTGTTEYREPFVGGGGVYFALEGKLLQRRWINDLNPGLVSVYEAFISKPAEFIALCRTIAPHQVGEAEISTKGTGKAYNKRLGEVFESFKYDEVMDQALRYFFLNRTVWAGRVNYDPDFESRLYYSNPNGWNVTKRPGFLEAIAEHMRGTELTKGDYGVLLESPPEIRERSPSTESMALPSTVWVYCFPAGSEIRDALGLEKPIECAKKGELLWGNKTVLNTFEHDYDGLLYSFKVQGTPTNACMTANHPVLVVRNSRTKAWQRQEKRSDEELLQSMELVEAEKVKVGDYFCIPLGGDYVSTDWEFDTTYVDPKWAHRKNNTKRLQPKFDNDEMVGEFLGYFAAEGHIHKKKGIPYGVTFNFNAADEQHLADRVSLIGQNVFGVKPRIWHPKGTSVIRVWFSSIMLGRFVQKWVPGQCRKIAVPNKSVNEKLISFAPNVLLAFIKAWLLGDGGCESKKNIRNRIKINGTTASKQMSLQIYRMALKCGLSPSYRRRTMTVQVGKNGNAYVPKWDIYFSSKDAAKLGYDYSGRILSTRRVVGSYLLSKVKEISSTEFTGKVYNVDVDGDSMICVDNVASHNCDPPYVVDTKLSPKSKLYECGFTFEDHELFVKRCKETQHRVCISYDDVPEVREWFTAADGFHVYEHQWTYCGTSQSEKTVGKELVITNYARDESRFQAQNKAPKTLKAPKKPRVKAQVPF